MANKSDEVIYCLVVIDGPPFYVGRSIQWHERYYEHRRAAKTGTEAKYQLIRSLWESGKDFEIVVLDENPKARYEKYYHYLLGCEYDLTNMKMGDAWATEQAIMKRIKSENRVFKGPDEFLTELDRQIAEEKARKKAELTQKKIRSQTCASDDHERTLFAGESLKERFMSPATKAFYAKRKKL